MSLLAANMLVLVGSTAPDSRTDRAYCCASLLAVILPLTMLKSDVRRRHCAPKPVGAGERNPTIAAGAVASNRAALCEACLGRAACNNQSEGDVVSSTPNDSYK